MIYAKPNQDVDTMRHSFAHVLAMAVLRLYPGTKMGIGPAIENGFYYDLELPKKLDKSDLINIEAEMTQIIKERLKFVQVKIPRDQAFDMLHQLGQIYKTELLHQIADEEISFYKTGDEFIDLCSGPHVKDTGELSYFKLSTIYKVNWLNDAKRPAMQRIIGVAFKSKPELDQYFEKQSDIEARNHKTLGKKLKIFDDSSQFGSNFPVFLPNGLTLKKLLKRQIFQVLDTAGFLEVQTPVLADINLYNASGAFNFNQAKFFGSITEGNNELLLKSDNSSHLMATFSLSTRSYRDLPYMVSEEATHFNKLNSTKKANLINAAGQECVDSLVICTPEQVKHQLIECFKTQHTILTVLGFGNYKTKLCLPDSDTPQNYIANETSWRDSIQLLNQTLEELQFRPKLENSGTPYFGPKISFLVRDTFEREWEISSISLDFNLPRLMNLKYVTNTDERKTPVAIHLSPIKSLETLIALLIEHYAGAFPLWMAPEQVRIIAISQKYNDLSKKLQDTLKSQDIRTTVDSRDETMQTKIRDGQLDQIPYLLIVGEKEASTDSVSVRPRVGKGDIGLMRVDAFINQLKKEIIDKK